MKIENKKFVCHTHPDRVAAVDKDGRYLCWECYLDKEQFLKRFGPDYYKNLKS